MAAVHPYRAFAAILALPVSLLVAGCGASTGPAQGGRLRVVATTTQVADMVSAVGGSRVSVISILRPNADPHTYEPRPSDASAVSGAALVVRSGGEIDASLAGLVDRGDAPTADLSRVVGLKPGGDPHWWQDPRNGILAVKEIRTRLARADPGGARTYARRARAYAARLRALDSRIARCISAIPRSRRLLVTDHDALGYFARRYGIELVGAVIPSLSSSGQPSAGEVSDLVAVIRRRGVRTIFPERSLSRKLETAIAREAGVPVGGALWSDALGPRGSTGATYAGSLAANAHTLAAGFTGDPSACAGA